jgi:GT2 family glycosyltransferase
MIHILTPYSPDKNLGKAYNLSCSLIPDTDWICLIDYDVQFLTHDAVSIMYGYAERNPGTFLTALCNRVHPLNTEQLLTGTVSDDTDMVNHIKLAEQRKSLAYQTKPLEKHMSGFLMLFPKTIWNDTSFKEGIGCLGVDTQFFRALKAKGVKTLVMQAIYVFHTYRLTTGIQNKQHLL